MKKQNDFENDKTLNVLSYEAPAIEVIEMVVERGFQGTGGVDKPIDGGSLDDD